jgi:hypothetical protein
MHEGGPTPPGFTGCGGGKVEFFGGAWMKAVVGWIAAMCSERLDGTEYCRVRMIEAFFMSWISKVWYSAASILFAFETFRPTDIQSPADEIGVGLRPWLCSQEVIAEDAASDGLKYDRTCRQPVRTKRHRIHVTDLLLREVLSVLAIAWSANGI